ncbi:hypothetical protein Hanom_Chr10g00930631 [Helianthus anomalus]
MQHLSESKQSSWYHCPSVKKYIAPLASVLKSYNGLLAGWTGNYNLVKEDYDQIDP